MAPYRIKTIAVIATLLGCFADAQAQTQTQTPLPADSVTQTPSMAGGAYQGLPGVWINRGSHLWYCQWQGNAAPRNQHIVCDSVELPAPSR